MKIKAIEPIKHDGKRREPGAAFEVPDEVGAALVAAKAAVAFTEPEPPVDPPEDPPADPPEDPPEDKAKGKGKGKK